MAAQAASAQPEAGGSLVPWPFIVPWRRLKPPSRVQMAGLPVSPPFANPAANAIAEFNTPAVAAGAITSTTVCAEASRKRKLYQAVGDGITSGGIPLVTPAEAGLADIRHASSIALANGLAVAPPWFANAMGPIEAQLANMAISRANRRVSYILKMSEHSHLQT